MVALIKAVAERWFHLSFCKSCKNYHYLTMRSVRFSYIVLKTILTSFYLLKSVVLCKNLIRWPMLAIRTLRFCNHVSARDQISQS